MKILFFGRDVRGGLGERRVFRVILHWLADQAPAPVKKNIDLIPEYGRFDDLLSLMDTACEQDALRVIASQLQADLAEDEEVGLLAKWLPSVNASNRDTVRMGKKIAHSLGMTDEKYRKTLVGLRKKIHILENDLRRKDYTFDYPRLPSKALFKYRAAFQRNDGQRYGAYLEKVSAGEAVMHTDALAPYELVQPYLALEHYGEGKRSFLRPMSQEEQKALNTTWEALPDFGGGENALAVIDTSGSMYFDARPLPAAVALSLGVYFAQHNTGVFRDHFIEFSATPQLIELKGRAFVERLRYAASFNEVANTDLEAVFDLTLRTAVQAQVPQEELPSILYIISDMEFDRCVGNADISNFENAKAKFAAYGYRLPKIVFWNVASRSRQQPVTQNEQGVALVSGCTPRLFQMVAAGVPSPHAVMMEIIGSERYARIGA